VDQEGEDMLHWLGTIMGPPDTPYEGGKFLVDITFPPKYPFEAPDVIFKTRVYHPKLKCGREVWLDILYDRWALGGKWAPAVTISKVLLSIYSLLEDPNPNPDDPVDPQIANHYKSDIQGFKQTARDWTRRYANQ
jgi:ubiquitin-conjugating enzyme E2 D/E